MIRTNQNTAIRKERFKRRVERWAKKVRVKPSQIRVQAMRTKWASCSPAGWITFDEGLLKKSRKFQDNVIVHELLHLKIPHHGRLFKSLLKAHLGGRLSMLSHSERSSVRHDVLR